MEKKILIQLLGDYSEMDYTIIHYLHKISDIVNNCESDDKNIAINQYIEKINKEMEDFNKLVSFLTDVIDN